MDVIDKDLASTILNVVKNLKKTAIKELKEIKEDDVSRILTKI
jgi:5-bromo-4-chloroindolyl phosphate hydrolysis protein